ncbi:hypothetical protein ABZS71_24115 [Streptomyces sp. NPDC005393]|uniref:hypothetical protein n=1 Tax=Streptomyces sp. NPDC005393 TaxID=3157041 RepID=UPI0033A89230
MLVAHEYDATGSTPGGAADGRGPNPVHAAVPGPAHPSAPSPAQAPAEAPTSDAVNEVIRWAAFSCAVVPIVLLMCGLPLSGAVGAAAGLAAVTAASHALLRHSERAAVRLGAGGVSPHRGRHGRTGIGAHRGGRHG